MFVFCASVFSQDFRGFNWGDAITKVKLNEKGKLIRDTVIGENNRRLSFEGNILQFKCVVGYSFNKSKKLIKAGYLFENTAKDYLDYEMMVSRIESELTKKYGSSVEDNGIASRIFKTNSNSRIWKNKSTTITDTWYKATSDNFLNIFYIDYEPAPDQNTGL